MEKFLIFAILLGIFPYAGIGAEITPGDLREAVIAGFKSDMPVECKIGSGWTIVWHNARERLVQVPTGKAKDMETKGERKMVPEGNGWVMEIYGPLDLLQSPKIWESRSDSSGGVWEQTWDVDGNITSFWQAERFIAAGKNTTGYRLVLTCGMDCNREILERFSLLVIPALLRLPTADLLRMDCGRGFSTLYYLFNRGQWDELPKSGIDILHDKVAAALDNPRQVILLHNAWSIPGLGGWEDIRLTDLQKNVFRDTLRFVQEWPVYCLPGYIVAVYKNNGQWALVAEMGGCFFIEDNGAMGVVRRDQ